MNKISDPIDIQIGIALAPPSIEYESLLDKYEEKLGNFFELKETMPSAYRYSFEEHRLPFVFSVDNFALTIVVALIVMGWLGFPSVILAG